MVDDFLEWREIGYNLGPSEPTEALALYYAVTSVAYYEQDVSLIPDGIYELLCKELLERTDVPSWVDKESLEAGTGYDSSTFPSTTDYIANELVGLTAY